MAVLIFSSVDIWGDDEDGITEENCSRDCQIVLVENIPEDLSLPLDGRPHLPLSLGFNTLLDQAKHSVEVVSPGQLLFQRLLSLKSRGVKLKIASSLTNSAELKTLAAHNAEIHFVNMTAFTRGGLHSSFWVVDRKHIYIGSADMDWRSLSKRKELGVVVYNCSCLALDLHRVFSFYWQLHERDYIPSIWSKRVTAIYGRHDALATTQRHRGCCLCTSPELFCARDRTRDVDAIHQVIQNAKTFIFISVTDYLPLVSRSFRGTSVTRYWSAIDEVIREAVVLRGVRVRLLISFWKKTHPLTFNFVSSLKSLCMQLPNCSIEVVRNHDWVGSDLAINTGVGLVVKMKNSLEDRGATILEQLKAAFERDWKSRYAKNLLGNKDQQGKYRNLKQGKMHMESKEENKWNNPLSL
ncbi:hypothetical protein F7725_016031 [Dissostichus mawsoni]|uniref:PLD phosphodiesterase domain-containing protein n=1 Tax=Dissostichus mawsoni TaxID=36200 RepID=A0A7J5Y4D2_DISMA|nr:hypothetical protein F7725_016031 [Dissostichus mawsoni]